MQHLGEICMAQHKKLERAMLYICGNYGLK